MELPGSSPQVLALLAAFVEEHTGIHYGLADRDVMKEKITARAVDAGFESLLDYYYFLRYDPASAEELDQLIDTLVVGETYFFRELAAPRVVVERVVPRLVALGRRPRIWSAACATGEEPLTLAMLLARAGLLEKVEIVASDISLRALERARSGQFRLRSMRAIPSDFPVDRWLREDGDRVVVERSLVEAVQWRRLNLIDDRSVRELGSFDVIFCRNVLIYFDDRTAAGVAQRLAHALAPGGLLFVGVSESLLRFGTGLTCEEQGGVFAYGKAG